MRILGYPFGQFSALSLVTAFDMVHSWSAPPPSNIIFTWLLRHCPLSCWFLILSNLGCFFLTSGPGMLGLGSWVSFLHVHPLLYELTHLWLQGPSHIDDHCIQLDVKSSHVSRCLPNISPWMSTQVSCSAHPKLAPDVSLHNLLFSTQFMILFYGSCTLSVAQIKNLRLLSSGVPCISSLSTSYGLYHQTPHGIHGQHRHWCGSRPLWVPLAGFPASPVAFCLRSLHSSRAFLSNSGSVVTPSDSCAGLYPTQGKPAGQHAPPFTSLSALSALLCSSHWPPAASDTLSPLPSFRRDLAVPPLPPGGSSTACAGLTPRAQVLPSSWDLPESTDPAVPCLPHGFPSLLHLHLLCLTFCIFFLFICFCFSTAVEAMWGKDFLSAVHGWVLSM